MPLRTADKTDKRRFEDDEAWLELRTVLTKGEGDRIRDLTAGYRIDQQSIGQGDAPAMVEIANRATDANRMLFECLAVAWSLGECSGQSYSDLDEESGQWVDRCIGEVLAERRERAEGKAQSSPKPSAPRGSTSKAPAST